MTLHQLSITQLHELTGIDRRTVKKRLDKLAPIAGPRGAMLYNPQEALPLLYKGSDSPEDASQALLDAQLRYEEARADKMRLEADKMAGLQVAIEDVAKAIEKEYTYVRATLYAMPSKLAKGLAFEEDAAVIQTQLHAAVDEALAHLQADTNLDFTPEEESEEAETEE